MENSGNNLLVLEYGGTARSGKGTIVSHLAARHEGVATEETGADYRMVTRVLLDEGVIDPQMAPIDIVNKVNDVGSGNLTDIVASRNVYQQMSGLEKLYETDVSTTVASVSPVEIVRKAVKAGFTKRIEAVRDSGDHEILLVDGRNLKPVIDKIDGVELGMRTFVSCNPSEGAWREVSRQGIEIGTKESQVAFVSAYEAIESRNRADANRAVDPVRPDANAIDYWYDFAVQRNTREWYARQEGHEGSADEWFLGEFGVENPKRKERELLRRSVGALAYTTMKQIKFETDCFRTHEQPKEAMLEAANITFEEAVVVHRYFKDAIRAALELFPSNYS